MRRAATAAAWWNVGFRGTYSIIHFLYRFFFAIGSIGLVLRRWRSSLALIVGTPRSWKFAARHGVLFLSGGCARDATTPYTFF